MPKKRFENKNLEFQKLIFKFGIGKYAPIRALNTTFDLSNEKLKYHSDAKPLLVMKYIIWINDVIKPNKIMIIEILKLSGNFSFFLGVFLIKKSSNKIVKKKVKEINKPKTLVWHNKNKIMDIKK